MPVERDDQLTSFHVRRAMDGDEESRAWVVARLSPLLRMQAAYRLPQSLARHVDPDDVVNEVWIVALRRLPDLTARGGRCTPVLLKFLGTTLLYIVNNLIGKHIRTKGQGRVLPFIDRSDGMSGHAADITSVLSRAHREEVRAMVQTGLDRLDDRDREILVLRGIEQIANHRVAVLLGEKESTVAMRYQRALKKMRQHLPRSVAEELAIY